MYLSVRIYASPSRQEDMDKMRTHTRLMRPNQTHRIINRTAFDGRRTTLSALARLGQYVSRNLKAIRWLRVSSARDVYFEA